MPAVASGHFLVVAIFENLLLATCSAWLIWRIVHGLSAESGASAWAVLLYCFEPVALLWSDKIMTETAFSTLLLLFIWLVIRFFREPTYATLLLAALVLGFATHTRPITLYLGLWLIPVFLFFPRTLPMGQRVSRAIVFVVVFALTLAPWILRNAKVADYPGFSSISDDNLYFYQAAAVEANLQNKSFGQQQEEMGFWDVQRYLQAHPEQSTWSRGQIAVFTRAEAKRIISQHLPIYLRLHARGFIILLFDTVATVILQTLGLYPERGGLLTRTVDQGLYRGMMWLIREHPVAGTVFVLLGIQLMFYYVLALFGVRHLPVAAACFFGSLLLYFILISSGPYASGRLRAPIMLLVCISAGIAVANWRPLRARAPKPV